MHFFLLQLCFYNCNICVTFSPFLLQESFVNVFFQTHLHENAFFYFLSIIINVFFAIFYFCCDFVFIIVNADVTFFLFLSKGLFKRFFLPQTLVFLLCLSKCFFCNFYTCCNFVFILVISALLFPFVTERFLADFSTAFSPKTAYFLPFCGISLAVHLHCKKIPLVVLGNCRFILQIFFVTVVLFFTIYY